MGRTTQYKECPNCEEEEGIKIELDTGELMKKLKNPLSARKEIKKAMNNPEESDFVDIKPCSNCGAVPESRKNSDEEDGDGDG